jgi:hypothetical protein
MKCRIPLAVLVLALAAPLATANEVFSYPPNPAGGVLTSSWVDPDGSDSDTYAYESFVLPETEAISEVRWRGGYSYGAMYGKAFGFTITFFATNVTGFEPLVLSLPDPYGEPCLANYVTGNAAGETPIGVVNGITMYDYRFVLSKPFVATGGVKYWIRIVAWQPTVPDWGIAKGTGGNGSHFRYITGYHMFQNAPGDTSFTLVAAWKDLGFGKVGSNGMPSLAGSGVFAAGGSGQLELAGAKSNAMAIGIVGNGALMAPFLGGTLVPSPDLMFAVTTSGSGKVVIPFTLPAATPQGIALHVQYWIADPAATQGYAASNALRGTTG